MKKLSLLLGMLMIAGATYACDGKKCDKNCKKEGEKKECCKKGEKKECCKDKKHCDKDKADKKA